VLGPLLGLSYHYLGEGFLSSVMEELMATSTLREVLAEAIEQGIEQGLERGMAQGIERGKIEGRREDILRILTRRFDPNAPAFNESLMRVDDPARLDMLFDAALTAQSLDEFAALLGDTPQ
jgi:hypothetical protein